MYVSIVFIYSDQNESRANSESNTVPECALIEYNGNSIHSTSGFGTEKCIRLTEGTESLRGKRTSTFNVFCVATTRSTQW